MQPLFNHFEYWWRNVNTEFVVADATEACLTYVRASPNFSSFDIGRAQVDLNLRDIAEKWGPLKQVRLIDQLPESPVTLSDNQRLEVDWYKLTNWLYSQRRAMQASLNHTAAGSMQDPSSGHWCPAPVQVQQPPIPEEPPRYEYPAKVRLVGPTLHQFPPNRPSSALDDRPFTIIDKRLRYLSLIEMLERNETIK